MPLTNYKYETRDSFPNAITEGYKQADKYWGIPGAASGAGQYAMHNKGRTGAIALVTLSVMALTAAYFLSSAYANFIGTVGTKTAALVSPAIIAISAFAVAHPLVASLVVFAAVVTLIAAPVYAYKNSNKAAKIEEVKQSVLSVCEKDGDNFKFDTDGHLVLDSNKNASTFLNDVAVTIGLVLAPAK